MHNSLFESFALLTVSDRRTAFARSAVLLFMFF